MASKSYMSGLTNQRLDDKGRLIIPIGFRKAIGLEIWLTLDADSNMVVIPDTRWEALYEIWGDQLLQHSDNQHLVDAIEKTLTFATYIDCSTRDWRVPIPEPIREVAELSKDIVTVGSLDRLVVWNRDKFIREAKERYRDPETLRLQRMILRGARLPEPPRPVVEGNNGDSETTHPGDGA